MIQQKELRVGNYVYAPTLDDNLYEISTISRYGRDCSVTDSKLGYQSSILDIENINPIPLTKIWLEKLKVTFTNDLYGGYLITLPVEGTAIRIMKDKEGYSWYSHCNYVRVDYIHQLQNLYFALTGEDLIIQQP